MRLQPAVPDAAVTREGDQICVSGLPLAATTTAVLRAGLPGVDGLSLAKDTPVALTLGNRAPRLLFNSALFILPHGQAPRGDADEHERVVGEGEHRAVHGADDAALGAGQ